MMNLIEKIMRNRILQHLVFWSISFYILLKNFGTTSVIVPVDLGERVEVYIAKHLHADYCVDEEQHSDQ